MQQASKKIPQVDMVTAFKRVDCRNENEHTPGKCPHLMYLMGRKGQIKLKGGKFNLVIRT